MERGLYAAASAMMAQQTIQDSIAQNIANANTAGYKQDVPTFKALHGMMLQRGTNAGASGPQIGELGLGVANDQIYTDWQPGAVAQTNNPLDASLDKGCFFTVRTANGERYTRAGSFKLDGAGNLLTQSGLPVLSKTGTPVVARGGNLSLDRYGNLLSAGKQVAQLKIVQGDMNQMQKDGDSLFSAVTPNAIRPSVLPVVNPGSVEQSNVNSVQSMVQMITVTRGFDMAQRALSTQDDLMRHASNELGKL